MKFPIYLDNHATTPVDPRVMDIMLPFFTEKFGNAASRNHAFGWEAEEAVENARKQIARSIHADPKEIVFTSGATESNNLALKGVTEMYHEKGDHIITSTTEHRAVLDTAKTLEAKRGVKVTYLPVDKFGMVSPDDVRNAITDKTVLISIMYANNEIGTINPIKEIGKIAKEKGVLFHCDATQGVGKVPINVQELGIDLRFGHRVTGVLPAADGARIEIATPAGDYRLACDWLLACDGARSTVRHALGLGFEGRVFKDKFLITDVRMAADFPPERWFWFDPPFHPGQSALLHSQPDQVFIRHCPGFQFVAKRVGAKGRAQTRPGSAGHTSAKRQRRK